MNRFTLIMLCALVWAAGAVNPARAGEACAPYLSAAGQANPERAEGLLRLANRLCPGWAAGRVALARLWLDQAAGLQDPNRAQALLYRALVLLGQAQALDPEDEGLANLLEEVRERESQLRASVPGAPLPAREVAKLLAPQRRRPPPQVAPLAAPRVDFPNLSFSAGTARLEPSALGQLNEIGQALKYLLPRLTVHIYGHTDRKGDPHANQALSLRRAHEVKRFLEERFGLDPARLKAHGLGFAAPLAGLSPYDPLNRRVEIRAVR